MELNKRKSNARQSTMLILSVVFLLSCSSVEKLFMTATPYPTHTPYPTQTPYPTNTVISINPSGLRNGLSELAGSWKDQGTDDVHKIEWQVDRFVVISVIDTDDGEIMDIISQTWENEVLTWEYYVNSTGYYRTFETISLEGNLLYCNWYGTAGSGTETLHRVP
jgi:hypothetical protein